MNAVTQPTTIPTIALSSSLSLFVEGAVTDKVVLRLVLGVDTILLHN